MHRTTGRLRTRRAGRGHAPASGRRRRRKAGEKSWAGLLGRRSPLRTPILGILFLVGIRSWVGGDAWILKAALKGHSGEVTSASFSPDGRRIATTGADGTARIWDARSGERLSTLDGHEGWVTAAAWSPDGKRVLTGGADETALLWDAGSGRWLSDLEGHEHWIVRVRFSSDGKRVLTADSRSACLWGPDGGDPLCSFRGEECKMRYALSPDGRRLASASDDGTLKTWDAESGECLRVFRSRPDDLAEAGEPEPPFVSLDFSPGGRLLVAACGEAASVFCARTGAALRTLRGHEAPVVFAAFSPDGKRIVTADRWCAVRVWEARTGRLLFALQEGRDTSSGRRISGPLPAVFSPDGRRIATARDDLNSTVRSARTGEELARLKGLCAGERPFSPDGRSVVTVGPGPEARVWKRRRPERASGYLHLPEVWLTAALGVALLWSLSRDVRG